MVAISRVHHTGRTKNKSELSTVALIIEERHFDIFDVFGHFELIFSITCSTYPMRIQMHRRLHEEVLIVS